MPEPDAPPLGLSTPAGEKGGPAGSRGDGGGGKARAERLRAVVEASLSAGAAGNGPSDEQVLAANPDLRPELDRELGLLRLIERARSSSRVISVSKAGLATAVLTGGMLAGGGPVPGLPERLEGYHVVREIHRGGQGVVYEAIQRSTGRRVAIKVRRESFFADRRDTERFQREVEILAQLEHPLIVGVIDSGVQDGRVYYVMDYIDGAPIDEYLAARALGVPSVLRLFEKIVAAVNAAHLRGVIHRDLKPANVLVDDSGEPHLLDFGLARLMAEIGEAARAGETMTGQFVGSLPWASPEQAEGQPSKIDLRTDVYALGVILFQMLTGKMPYRVDQSEGGLRTAIDMILTAQPVRPSSLRRGVDSDLDTITLKCLSKERARRYQSAGELAEDVRRYLDDRPIAARPPSLRYQFGRFARRNRVLVAAAAAVAGALAVGSVATLVQLGRARQAERLAESRRVEAERQAYVANIYAADAAVKLGDGGTAMLRLEAAPPAIRGWDWGYLHGQADQSRSHLLTGGRTHSAPELGAGLVISACQSGEAAAYDPATGSVVWKRAAPEAFCACAQGERAAIVTGHDTVVVDARTGNEVRRLRTADPPTKNLAGAFVGDKSLIAVGVDGGGGVKVYDLATGAAVFSTPKCANCWNAGVDATADGELLAYYDDADVVVVRVQGWSEVWRRPIRTLRASEYGLVRFSPDGRRLAASVDERIEVFDAADGRARGSLAGHGQPVLCMAFDQSGERLASGSIDKSIRLWTSSRSAEGGEDRWTQRVLCGHAGVVRGLTMAADGRTLWSFGDEGSALTWDLEEAGSARSYSFEAVSNVRSECWFGPDGVLYNTTSKSVVLINPQTGRVIDRTELLPVGFVSLIDARGGRAFGMRSATEIAAVDMRSAGVIWKSECALGLSWMMALSGDGRVLAGTDRDNAVRLWRAEDGAPLAALPGHQGRLRSLRFDGSGRRLASTADDGTARVWDVGANREVLVIRTGAGSVHDCAFSPDDRLLATGDDAGEVGLWNAQTGEAVWRSPALGSAVATVRFHPDGTRMATGGRDGLLRVWDAGNGDELLQLRGHGDTISGLAWSEDGRWLASTSFQHLVRIWDGGAGGLAGVQGQPVK